MLISVGNWAANITTKRRLETVPIALSTAITASIKGHVMCLAAIIVVAAVSAFTTGARADGSWCAMYGTGGTNCGLYSLSGAMPTSSAASVRNTSGFPPMTTAIE